MAGNGSIVTLDLPKPLAAGEPATVSIDEVTNAFAARTTSLTLWTSSHPVPVRLPLTLTTPGSISGASAKLSSTAAGATSVDYEIRFRTGVYCGVLAPGDGPLQGGVGSVPTEAVTLLAPPGTVFPNCFGFEQGCWPTYVIDGQPVVGNLARDGAMVTLGRAEGGGRWTSALDLYRRGDQRLCHGPDQLGRVDFVRPCSGADPPFPDRPKGGLSAIAQYVDHLRRGLGRHLTRWPSRPVPRVLCRATYGELQGGIGSSPTETINLEAPQGTKFAECLSGCPDYPSYLVDGADAGASFSAGGRVLSLALPKPIAPSTRVGAPSIGEVSNSVTAGPKKLLVWTSDDPRPAVLAYSPYPPRCRDLPCGFGTGCRRASATYTVTWRSSAGGALATGFDGGSGGRA